MHDTQRLTARSQLIYSFTTVLEVVSMLYSSCAKHVFFCAKHSRLCTLNIELSEVLIIYPFPIFTLQYILAVCCLKILSLIFNSIAIKLILFRH